MSRAIQLQNHPFRFLLYLEWGLLAIAIINAIDAPSGPSLRRAALPSYSLLLALLPLLAFGLMGLYLPQNRQKVLQLCHALGQIFLILLLSATTANGGRIFPVVYLIMVIRSCLMFALFGRLLMAGLAFVLFATGLQIRLRSLALISQTLSPPARRHLGRVVLGLHLNFIVLFGLSLLLVVLLINALLTERQSQARLQQANETLRQSAQEIEKLAMDQERSRIARDIHDALGHSLTALNIQLESALKLAERDPGRSHQFLKAAKQLGTQALQDVRHSVAALRQDPLAGATLEKAIARLLQDLEKDSSITTVQTFSLAQPLPANLKVILYRIVQEGLTNIVKHAEASHVALQLVSSTAVVTLTLEDNGNGFDPEKAGTGFGLQSMRDRTQSAGGTFIIVSPAQLGRGTRIQIALPVSLPLPVSFPAPLPVSPITPITTPLTSLPVSPTAAPPVPQSFPHDQNSHR